MPHKYEDKLLELAEVAKQELIPLLKEALTACAERHQLTLNEGSDNFSFGTDAWSFPKHFFKNHLNGQSTQIRFSLRDGCVLVFGPFEIRHHRVGSDVSDNILVSFPKGARAICSDVTEQLAFEFIGEDEAYSGHVVLAYMASPERGLEAAYLAVPGKIEDDKIVAWGQTLEIYRRDLDPGLLVQDNGDGPQRPDPEKVEAPQVILVKKTKKEET